MKLLSSPSQFVGATYVEEDDYTESSMDPFLLSYHQSRKGGNGYLATTSGNVCCKRVVVNDDDDNTSVATGNDTELSGSFAQISFIEANLVSSVDLCFAQDSDDDDEDTDVEFYNHGRSNDDESMIYPFAKRANRRVKFEVDSNDNIIVHTSAYRVHYDSYDDDDDDDDDEQRIIKSNVYTTADEEQESHRKFRKTCRRLLKKNGQMIAKMDCCYAACEVDDNALSNYLELCIEWSDSELRGLETTFSDQASDHVRNYTSLVLDYHSQLIQSYILSETASEENVVDAIDSINEKLRIRIEKESSKSRRFAICLAMADAVVA